jgi:hypothetical protein
MTIQTVKEYNSKQSGAGMMFLTKKGAPCKVGFVVEYNGEFIYKRKKKDAEKVTVKDFEKEESPIWYNADLGISNLEYINQ